ncbi:hypothetical protein NIA73_01460 [Anaerobutyricum hallii]|nr:hypothetical protein [Anaerobutyricum hallii]MCO7152210.1 hypothetical protein [Anaerobutyricum hallii]
MGVEDESLPEREEDVPDKTEEPVEEKSIRGGRTCRGSGRGRSSPGRRICVCKRRRKT